jgi:hypothetical protein
MNDRRERIVVLLENYVDVEAQGLRDRRGDGEHLPLMSRAWNHPSYCELRRLLGVMRDGQWHLYWNLVHTYYYANYVRRLHCPRCKAIIPTTRSANFHKHGHSNVAIVPKMVRVTHADVREPVVADAVDWLEAHWQGPLFIPDELLPVVA